MKFVATDKVTVIDSEMKRNFGVGFWADFEVDDILVRRNDISDNAGRGVQIEISKNAVVDDNDIHCNARLRQWSLDRSWYWGSNLMAKNSTNVLIEDNDVIVDFGQAIAVIDNQFTGRFFGTRDFRRAKDNTVQNNTISFTNARRPAISDPGHYSHQMMGLESDGPASTAGDGALNCTAPNDFLEQGLVSAADIRACNAAGGMDATSSAANNVIKDNTYNIVNNSYTYWRYGGQFFASGQIPRPDNTFDFAAVTRQNASRIVTCN